MERLVLAELALKEKHPGRNHSDCSKYLIIVV
jgi:hypothetical protein